MESLRKTISSAILFMLCSLIYAQDEVTISGTIADETGSPVIGATIVEKDTANRTVADIDGDLSLSTNEGTPLTISYIGCSTIGAKAAAKTNAQLKQEANELNEIIVTGYTTQRKVDLTGAVSVVRTDAVKTFLDADPMKALQGCVAGVTTIDAGPSSSTTTVRIHSIRLLNSSQGPLFIVDGVSTTNGIDALSFNDIEGMQVLKDTASASIYGSRATNGIIIITAKQGKKADKVEVDLTANLTA